MRWDGGGNRRFDQQEANCENRLAMEDLRDAVLQQLRNCGRAYSITVLRNTVSIR